MADRARPALTLRLQAGTGGDWSVSVDGLTWRATPHWPSAVEVAQLAWLVEEEVFADQLPQFSADTEGLARRLGQRLWTSLVEAAPSRGTGSLAGRLTRIELDGGAAEHLWALNFLTDKTGAWLALSGVEIVQLTGRRSSDVAPLRVLLVTARPGGQDDVAYLSLAIPLAEAAAQSGFELHRLCPATRSAIGRRLQSAREAGTPYSAIVFDGHGAFTTGGQPCLMLETRRGDTALIEAGSFSSALADNCPALVVLAACRTARSSQGGLEAASSFAGALAQSAGVDVVSMASNVAPDLVSAFLVRLFAGLAAGKALSGAIVQARADLAEGRRLSWSAPVHMGHGALRFSPGAPAAPPPIVGRRDGIAQQLDRAFLDEAVAVVVGVPLIGKTSLGQFYAWWRSLAFPNAPPAQVLDATAFETPYHLLDVTLDEVCVDDRLIIIDNVGVWRALDPGELEIFRKIAVRLAPRGVRWLLLTRSPIPLGDEGVAPVIALQGLSDFGANGKSSADAAGIALFGRQWREDPWLALLVIATRAEPVLLNWAREAHSGGEGGLSLLQRFLQPDAVFLRELAEVLPPGDDLSVAPPVLGWMFGMDQCHLIASLSLDLDQWDTQAHAVSAVHWRDHLVDLAAQGLALPSPGERFVFSAVQAAILRARSPLSAWTRDERKRYAHYMTVVTWAFDLKDAPLPDRLRDLADELSANGGGRAFSENKLLWVSLLLSTPLAFVAAVLAAEEGLSKILANIVSGLNRVFLEFGLTESGQAWVGHWLSQALIEGGTDDEAARARDKLEEEVQRSALLSGALDMAVAGEQRLLDALGAMAEEFASAGVRAGLARLAQATRSGRRFAPGKLEDVLNAAFFLAAEVGPKGHRLDDLDHLAAAFTDVDDPFSQARLDIMRAMALNAANRFEEAETVARRADARCRDLTAYPRYLARMTLLEILTLTDAPDMLTMAQEGLVLAHQLGDDLAIGQAQMRLGMVHGARGEIERARALGLEAMPRLGAMSVTQCQLMLWLSNMGLVDDDLAFAEACRAQAEALARRMGPSLLYLEALAQGPIIAFQAGDEETAAVKAQAALEAALAHSHQHSEGVARWILAEVHNRRCNFEAAVAEAERATQVLRPTTEAYLGYAWAALARARFGLDDYSAALEAQQRAGEALDRHFVEPRDQAIGWAPVEVYALAAGEFEIAEAVGARISALGYGIRTLEQLSMAAEGWLERAARPDLAALRAREALNRFSGIPADWEAWLRGLAKASD